jgi:aryl-alcohol dehydrogenase-like predicted oxidoreductase
MRYKTLGHTGLVVSTLSLGAMTFHGGKGTFRNVGTIDQEGADRFIRISFEAGINFFNTADVYSEGESERTLGQSLKNLNIARKDVVLATMFGLRTGSGRNDTGASRGHIMDSIEASLRRLQTDYIDLYQIHTDDTITPIEETLRTLDTLVRQGKVRYIGCSNWQAWRIAKALGISELRNLIRLDTVQAYYSLASRDIERELVPLVESEKTGLLVWSPLAAGLLSGKFSRENEKPQGSRRSAFDTPYVDKERAWKILETIAPIAKAHGCSPARISLAWLLTRPAVTSVIVGAKRLDQLQDNLAVAGLTLTNEEIKQLDEVSAPPPEFPGWVSWFADRGRVQP